MAMPAWTCVITIFCVFENIQIAFQYSWPVQNSWPGAQGTWVSNQDTNNNGYNDNNNNNNGYNSNNNNGYNNNNNNNNNGNNKNGYNNNNNNNNNNKNNNNNYAGVAGSPPVVIPASTKQTASLIFFHGLSNQADRFTGIFQSQIRVPYMKFIFPNAASRPVSLMAGMRTPAWFDLMGYSSNSPEDEPGIEKAKNYAHALIRAEIAAGIPPERIIVGGYSQGAALAIYAGITFNQTLGGIISLSGWLLESSQIPGNNQANRKTPIFVGHGRQDQYVQFNFAQMTVQALNSFDPNVQFNQYSSMGHDSTPEEHHDVFQFIENHVPPTAS